MTRIDSRGNIGVDGNNRNENKHGLAPFERLRPSHSAQFRGHRGNCRTTAPPIGGKRGNKEAKRPPKQKLFRNYTQRVCASDAAVRQQEKVMRTRSMPMTTMIHCDSNWLTNEAFHYHQDSLRLKSVQH